MKEPRLRIPEGMRRALDAPRFAGTTRMLILTTEYFFDQIWQRAANQLGWETATVSSVITGGLTRNQIRDLFLAVGEFRPDFIITSNYAGMDVAGLFSRFFEDARIPYVSWFTDTPRMILYDREVYCSHYSVAATWERGFIKHFEQLGFQHVHFMPHAADPALFNGAPADTFDRQVGFVGASMINHADEAWEKLDESVPEVAAAIRRAFAEGRVTREAFTSGIENIIEQRYLDQCGKRDLRHVELCLIYEATKRSRIEMVRRLAPLGVEVRGDPHWAHVTPNHGGQVGYFDDLAPYYRRTAVNLNTTSIQARTSLNQRVFDCPAAGGFLITDDQADIHELFDEDEAVTYRTMDELEDKTRYYLAHPEERKAIVQRAQRRIAAHHTHKHRLESLEAYLKERYAG